MKKRFFLFGLMYSLFITVYAQNPTFNYVNEADLQSYTSARRIVPNKAFVFETDFTQLRFFLDQAPGELVSNSGMLMKLPMPDGSNQDFIIWQYDMMEAPLAASLPGIRTFLGKGKSDPWAIIRIDYTYLGFHAYISSPSGVVSIDPFAQGNTQYYQSYYKDDLPNIHIEHFTCDLKDDILETTDNNTEKTLQPLGTTLRKYRMALACTGEYATYHGGTVASVASAMTTAMNRVNGVYEKDLSARMILVADNNNLIYLNASSDPYSNNDGSAMLGQNQTTCNSVIGSSNYDIGHVFSTGGGGVAYLASLCSNSNKAKGVTGLPAPTGDPFYIDYVCHEVGHQFNGGHTFNSSSGSCGGGNRSASDAFEPGSGSTIMAYAGICAPDDIQNNSNDYFHARSYQTIYSHIVTGVPGCPTTNSTGNTPPTVNAGNGGRYVPVSTPFKLTAVGNDANSDPLTYCWEEYDLGQSIALSATPVSGTPPLFRSYKPDTSATRWFPRLQTVINNASDNKEKLPTYTRIMKFRCMVRDNVPNGGGVSYDTIGYNFTAAAGPFLVTSPNTSGDYWTSNSTQTVTWDVANTNVSPVSCTSVNIRLSVDGGYTYPYLLIANTPNDGSQTITVPNILTQKTTCRVMVESINNIFYDISNANFTVSPTTPTPPVAAFSTSASTVCEGKFINFSDQSTNNPTSWSWSFGGGTPASSTSQNPTNIQFNTAGTYTVSLTATNQAGSNTIQQTIVVNPLPQATFSIVPASYAQSNGSATANPTVGQPPFSYVWLTSPVQTGQTAVNLPEGNVGVSITDNNGCTQNYNITIPGNASMDESTLINHIAVYPNPASESVFISLDEGLGTGSFNLALINSLGQMVMNQVYTNQLFIEVPVESLATGYYVVKLTINGYTIHRPLIIRK